MKENLQRYLDYPLEEPIDERRYERHATFVTTDLLSDRLSPQGYRPEILAARRDLSRRHKCSPLQSLCRLKVMQGTTPVYGDDGLVCIKPQHVRPLLVEADESSRVSAAFSIEKSRAAVSGEAVLVNRSGAITLGRTGLFLGGSSVFVSEHVFACFTKPSLDAGFLAAFLNSWWGKRSLEAGIAGSTGQLQLPQSHLSSVPIPTVSEHLQLAIGNKLRKADRLSVLAQRIWRDVNSHLEQMLGVDLSPDRFSSFSKEELYSADYECRSIVPPVSNAIVSDELGAQYFHPRRVHARLIASRVKSVQSLRTLATRVGKGTGSESNFVGLDAIDPVTGVVDCAVIESTGEETGSSRFKPKDVLVSRLRPYLNKVAIWPEHRGDGRGSGELLVYRPLSINSHYLFLLIKSTLGLHQIIDVTAGSTHPRVDAEVVDQILIPRLGDDVENDIGSLVSNAHSYWYECQLLLPQVKNDVESLLDGTLDEARLVKEGKDIALWLESNPMPAHKGSE